MKWYCCVYRLLSLSQQALTDSSLPDELLFGRSGYLLSLLFVRHHLGSETVPQTVIRQVGIGTRLSCACSFPSKSTGSDNVLSCRRIISYHAIVYIVISCTFYKHSQSIYYSCSNFDEYPTCKNVIDSVRTINVSDKV